MKTTDEIAYRIASDVEDAMADALAAERARADALAEALLDCTRKLFIAVHSQAGDEFAKATVAEYYAALAAYESDAPKEAGG